ncbi:hypothetical protein DIPPA_20494 [Diplonema papillatum]|nr:hypothetical protein DIPPA_20494 [Diplonema papillatum]
MTDGDELEKDLESVLTCPVCLDLLDKPYRLDCEHAFCQTCLQKLVKSDSAYLVCPACRVFTTLKLPGFLGLSKLPMDFKLADLVERYKRKVRQHHASDEEAIDVTPRSLPEGPQGTEEAGGDLDDPPVHITVETCCEVLHGFVAYSLSVRRAKEVFEAWKSQLWLCPTDFPKRATLKHVRMVSVPFYVYSVSTHVRFKAELSCPQDGKSSLPPAKVSTKTDKTRASVDLPANSDPCSNHPSRRWILGVIGSTVTLETIRDLSAAADQGWSTWLWSTLSTVVPHHHLAGRAPPAPARATSPVCRAAPMPDEAPSSNTSTCSTEHNPPITSSSASCTSPGTKPKHKILVDNLEISSKVGQTYVSSTQPMQRKLKIEGVHTNEFSNIVVCASFAVDNDLVAAQLKGHSKDSDLKISLKDAFLVKHSPPQQGEIEAYLKKVLSLIQQSSSLSSTAAVPSTAAEKPAAEPAAGKREKRDKKQKKKKPKKTEARNDPGAALDEMLRTPAASRAAPGSADDGFPEHLMYTDAADDVNDFFDDTSPTAYFPTSSAPPKTTSSGSYDDDDTAQDAAPRMSSVYDDYEGAYPAASTTVHAAAAPAHQGSMMSTGSSKGNPTHPTGSDPESADGTGRIIAPMEENYFASQTTADEGASVDPITTYGEPEVLVPERRSEDAWNEQIWPHVQEKELEFTNGVIKAMEPKNAVVTSSTVELTVTDLKQRAILVPCYICTYVYEGKQYDVIIHGRTGEVHGKRPWLGSSAYDSVKKEVEGQVINVKHYIEESLDHLAHNRLLT